jgi:hypothetical protein
VLTVQVAMPGTVAQAVQAVLVSWVMPQVKVVMAVLQSVVALVEDQQQQELLGMVATEAQVGQATAATLVKMVPQVVPVVQAVMRPQASLVTVAAAAAVAAVAVVWTVPQEHHLARMEQLAVTVVLAPLGAQVGKGVQVLVTTVTVAAVAAVVQQAWRATAAPEQMVTQSVRMVATVVRVETQI